MTWETPSIQEIACGLEVTAYAPAETRKTAKFSEFSMKAPFSGRQPAAAFRSGTAAVLCVL